MKSKCECFTPNDLLKLVSLDYQIQEPDLTKKRHLELNGFQRLLDISRQKMMTGSWDEKHGACLALKEMAVSRVLCQECLEDALCRALIIISKDQVADYTDDLPVYPLRELASDIVATSQYAVNKNLLEDSLAYLLEISEPQGPLICMRKALIYTEKAYERIKYW